MVPLVQRVWKGLLKNYDVYVVIVIALVLSILSIVGRVSVPVVFSGTLVTLAIIAFSLLKNRQTDETIEKALEQLWTTQQCISILQFFKE